MKRIERIAPAIHHPPSTIHHSRPARRGVLLLLILALLAMFGLIAVAFVLLSGHAQRGARSVERMDLVSDPPPELLEQAAMQVFRGSTNPASVIGAHSLLEDIYGTNWTRGTIALTGNYPCGGQLIEFQFNRTSGATTPTVRTGCVVTVVDLTSPAYGRSSRIVGSDPATPSNWQMLAFDGPGQPQNGNEVIISGAPFSGTGFGYDTTTGDLDETGSSGLLALTPNDVLNKGMNVPPGGANEDYDAADFQNMLLAAQIPDSSAPGGIQTLPSLHRPQLVRYWAAPARNGSSFTADALRPIMLRPIGPVGPSSSITVSSPDHPNFTGSNPNFNPTWNGVTADGSQWDVDNDGDGVPDSVWVDLGLPVRSTVDGRLYKPLFAILCVDMDGRLNLNAHGCLAQLAPPPVTPPPGHGFAGGTPGSLPRGVGYGPAEINLSNLLGTTYQQLLTCRYPASSWLGGLAGHRLSANKWFLYGGSYWNAGTAATVNYAGAYGTPPDLVGMAAIGVDYGGRALYVLTTMGQVLDDVAIENIQAVQCPYEYNLSAKRVHGALSATWGNCPYSVGELERILRPYDRDATSLPARLAQATAPAPGYLPQQSFLLSQRHAVTTESWDVPGPSAALSRELLEGGATGVGTLVGYLPTQHVTDVLKILLVKQTSGLTLAQAESLLPQLFAPELLAGRKMDLNRAFGDARDNDASGSPGHGVVDQSEPSETGETVTFYNSPTTTDTAAVSRDPSGTLMTSLEARQLYARYLYVLAMLLADRTELQAQVPGATAPDDVARFLAQWAVNAVDFYDSDTIMTPFEYDPDPFETTGWAPPGDAAHRVWGCERPELLIGETLALHDRRVQNVPVALNGPTWYPVETTQPLPPPTSTPPWKSTFSQQKVPQGSLFIELYNPWTDQEPVPQELADTAGSGIELSKSTPGASSCPVWRMVIVPGDAATATDDPDLDDGDPTPNVMRSIYFADPSALGASAQDGERFYTTATYSVSPGKYVVVGSADSMTLTTTHLGRLASTDPKTSDDPADGGNTRKIQLAPVLGGTPVQNNRPGGTTPNPDPPDGQIQPCLRVPIHVPRRLNISDPNGGYIGLAAVPPHDADGVYDPPLDRPLDYEDQGRNALIAAAVKTNGTRASVAIVHLQRLANPLRPYQGDPAMADYNPYRTVDSMPIDLVAFNGWDEADVDPSSHVPPYHGEGATPGTMMVASHERGAAAGAFVGVNDIWTIDLTEKTLATTRTETTATNVFDRVLKHSLGFMNHSLAIETGELVRGRLPSGDNRGDPNGSAQSPPFPWVTWNNRPFVSQLELTLVPWVKSSQLGKHFSIRRAGNPYTDTNMARPYAHLPDFFQSDTKLSRLLDFVGVPSRFVGTEIQADPTAAASGSHMFHTPFNRIPTYREPGKINLNTIFSEEVYNGLMAGCPGLTWDEFQRSRKGYFATNPTDCPTMFGQPFRSSAGAHLVPDLAPIDALKPTTDWEVDATLLRSDGNVADARPLFKFVHGGNYNDPGRHPFFYYHAMQRLGNLTTTRSNVYAVWITVGYFEAESVAVDAVHPDGYRLGRELGMDTGEIERHRAFYMFDRTLPVGFQRGEDLNVEKAVLVGRFIE